MADDPKPISEEEAIQRAKEEFGEETIAKLQGLPPDVKAALLGDSPPAPTPKKHAGGRKKGSGKDYAPALRRMAELQEDGSTDSFRDLAKQVNKELKAAGYTADAIRKKYRPHSYREKLRAAIRRERRPRYRAAVKASADLPGASSASSLPSLADYAREAAGVIEAVEAAKRAALMPDLRALLGPGPEEVARLLAPQMLFSDHARKVAESVTGLSSSLAAVEEEIRRKIDSSSAEALRGLHLLLGKKPAG